MGNLDDAIREHLELKRKHGASGEDLERLEKEAFGPLTRPGDPEFEGEAASDSEGFDRPPEGDVSPAEQGRADYGHLEDTADHPTVAEPDAVESESEPPESAIFSDVDEQELGELESDDGEAEPAPRSEPAALDDDDDDLEIDFDLSLGGEPESAPGTATTAPAATPEFEADDAAEDDLEDEEEDLLEETPDFLQDAPDGERLWFEQGEPKDFDFEDD